MDISGIGYSMLFAALGIPLGILSAIGIYLVEKYDNAIKDEEKKNIRTSICYYIILIIIVVVVMVVIGNVLIDYGNKLEQPILPKPSEVSQGNPNTTYIINNYNITQIYIENKNTGLSVEEFKNLIQLRN